MTSLFTEWTPEERWLAGLLWADGHLLPTRHMGTVVLNLTDEPALAAAAAITGQTYRTQQQAPTAKGTVRLPLHRLQFTDREAAGRLAALGFGPKPDRAWPAALASGAFMRGLFDGDGCVLWRCVRGRNYLLARLRGPVAVLDGAQKWLADQGFPARRVYPDGDGHTVQWSHRDSLRLAEVMYSEPGPFMARKRDVFYMARP